MNIVLLSGGSGKRLWPLSNNTLSKQFLKLLKNEHGEYESMVQRVMRQIKMAHPATNVFVSCNASQADMLQQQLDAVETIFEPSRRDTFPAIVLAAAYLYYEKNLDLHETFVACPIDTFAEDEYFQLLAKVEALVSSEQKKIGLLGALPTYPSEKYGYILQNKGTVTSFVEKPPCDKAEKLLAEGALWNCGVFAIKIGYVLEHARKYVDFDSYEQLYERYDNLLKTSFDYEVVEKEPSIGVVSYGGVWKDLGTWNTLTEEMESTSMGQEVLVSESCSNSHVLNMLNIPVVAQDLQDMVVVASHDGILVSTKQGSSFLKPLVEQIDLRPMYEQRRWGDYRVLDYMQAEGSSSLVKRMHIKAGEALSYQYHAQRSETWIIVNGDGVVTIDGNTSEVSAGSVVQIPRESKHSLFATTDLDFIEVQLGTGELGEEDITRIIE
ncbi:MAG: sugar phosphate nucleotidyltransferase [Coriobacteriia bacterium]|nr:sugar phosphate nucleotidyltransferase [Coriobacteriia bacterium]